MKKDKLIKEYEEETANIEIELLYSEVSTLINVIPKVLSNNELFEDNSEKIVLNMILDNLKNKLDHKSIKLIFSKDEALVYFEWLYRNEERDEVCEEQSLFKILCSLEKTLLEPSYDNYYDIIIKSRKSILESYTE